MLELGINIDHVATLRQARRGFEPDPVSAASQAELGGADTITIHLREDRRHIQDRDVRMLSEVIQVKFNFELACDGTVLALASELGPDQATLVPEKREEVTTEGGLDLLSDAGRVEKAIHQLKEAGISVSLFLAPDLKQIDAAKKLNVDAVELHTGQYALAKGEQQSTELQRLADAAKQIVDSGMHLHAGHGLNYVNVQAVALLPHMRELNIGHSVISRAVFVGLQQAVRDMKNILLHL